MTNPKPSNQASSAHSSASKHIPLKPMDGEGLLSKIYTRSFTGHFRSLRMLGCGLLFLLYFGTCWLTIDGRQAVLFDLPTRQFHVFTLTFWPQDLLLLGYLLLICAFGLFTITVFAGRIWCGYTCPQSVFTWLFMWIEKITEGERYQRIKQDQQGVTAVIWLKKAAKHSLWLLVALTTALTFVGYFTPMQSLVVDVFSLDVSGMALFWISFFTIATYLNAGYLREKVCLHMCPYARFQSVMFDNDTLIVAYDTARGEPRGSRKRGEDYQTQNLGSCIDCTLCVQVCPTGIDIRQGLQYECIGCAACVDVCNDVMDKMHYRKGLIRYTTENALQKGKTQWLRLRLIGYLSALLIAMVLFGISIAHQKSFTFDVIKDSSVVYRTLSDGRIENIYLLKMGNKTTQPLTMTLTVDGIAGLGINGASDNTPLQFTLAPQGVEQHLIRLQVPKSSISQFSQPLQFQLQHDNKQIKVESRFNGVNP